MLQLLGFFLSSFIAGILILVRLTGDAMSLFGMKKSLTKLAISNWSQSLPRTLPVYNTNDPKSAKEAGILAQDEEWEVEKPRKLEALGDVEDLLLYGVDDKGNTLTVKILRTWNKATKIAIVLQLGRRSYSVTLEECTESDREFVLSNFKLELIEPFRAWRLWYNGVMEDNLSSDECFAHVTINFLWKPLEYAKDFRRNANSSLLAQTLTYQGRFGEALLETKKLVPKGYHQFGALHGIVKINDCQEELYLYGFRTRRYFTHTNDDSKANYLEFFAMRDSSGDAVRLVGSNDLWIDGECLYPSHSVNPVEKVDAEARCFHSHSSLPKFVEVKDKSSTMRIEIWPRFHVTNIQDILCVIALQTNINGHHANGVIVRTSARNMELIPSIPKPKTSRDLMEPLLLALDSSACHDKNLVGGKAASLARLSQLNNSIKGFNTARGFCTTTTMFEQVIDMKRLEGLFQSEGGLDTLCEKVSEYIKSPSNIDKIRPWILQQIEIIFGDNCSLTFAVRSSGVLEDGSDLSCAGQNETYLGVFSKDMVAEKVVSCWASLYTFQSVTYRLNHGLPLVTEMGVVIQEMVRAVTAGVLFTANPRTGNPFEMVITANYGLGESVVSGSCVPDTISVLRSRKKEAAGRCDKSYLTVGEVVIGSKESRVVCDQAGSVVEKSVDFQNATELCLSEHLILELSSIACALETEIGRGKPVDVEWAITEEGAIFMLQCRPMTSLDSWTDFEIMHQFDSAIRSRNELLTTANTGEVMPKPLHPISIQAMNRNIDIGIQNRTSKASQSPICILLSRGCPIFCNRVFIAVYHTLYRRIAAEIDPPVCCVDLTVFGRPMITKEVHQVAVERYGAASGRIKAGALMHGFKLIRNCPEMVEDAVRTYSNWTIKMNQGVPLNAKNVYEQITNAFVPLHEILLHHCATSEASTTSLVFAFVVLTEGKSLDQWATAVYEDAAKLLSVYSAVESAEIPNDINELRDRFVECQTIQEFLKARSVHDAVQWVKSNVGACGAWDKFIEKHGHRSICELDVGQDSWKQNPSPLIELLKNVIRNKLKSPSVNTNKNRQEEKAMEPQTEEELLNSLKTPLKASTKRFLKFLLPHCRRMVVCREKTKSLSVRVLGEIKEAYDLLSNLMVKERLLPEKSLIKHMLHHEIGNLIDRHPTSSAILSRSTRRKRLYATLEENDFPEMCVGVPQPICNSVNIEATSMVKGTPVSAGRVKGVAKVCITVEEAASQIEQGDILITKATDIAWSPFFPTLGGVVTELGGLISHGAVVAREYGLPCIVGAVNATRIFRSGDEVILDTSSGTIAKVLHP